MKRAFLAAGLCLAASSLQAGDASHADVRVVCALSVGGSFEAKTTALTGTLTPVGPSELTVDLKSLDTGIGLRNEHLRDTYLEVDKGAGFDTAVLSAIRIAAPDPATFQGRTTFSGTLRLHGVDKAVAGDVELRREGTSLRVTASFSILLPDFGIAKPRYLGVGVTDEVRVNVTLLVAEPR
jgi:polyisoprenoid-binding protein YceI